MGADPANHNFRGIGSFGFCWWLPARSYRLRVMGAGNGCARIYHSSCGRDHGAATAPAFSVRALYRGLWSLMVHRRREYGKALRRLHLSTNHLFRRRSNSSSSGIHHCQETILNMFS